MRRGALLTLFLAGAVISFGIAVWSAIHGRLPVLELAHAVLFTLLALVVAAAPEAAAAEVCRECGRGAMAGIAFCVGCGRHDADRRRFPAGS